ncbi:MAG: LON peptidase substrate-binding domain-containing protein, partial [SAR324 cluster bacterium]|nr:LON peptidase substrate-binding domain-containing protein [SAR324 cluster bacterium]
MADPSYPDAIPVFPLTGVLLLPGMALPLHIFEQRYRNMIADAWEGARLIGMVQPVVPRQDNRPVPDASAQNPDALAQNPDAPGHDPELYAVGCVGRIAQCQRADDGRYRIVLQGEQRFRISRELPLHRGYRRVAADFSEFANDPFENSHPLESKPILEGLRSFAEAGGMKVNFPALENFPAIELVNSLAISLPFGPSEKQALLEPPGP